MAAKRRGRPPRVPNEPVTRHVDVGLTEREWRALRALARANHLSMVDLVRVAVNTLVGDMADVDEDVCILLTTPRAHAGIISGANSDD